MKTPKTDASVRTIALDADTATMLRTHRQRRLQQRLATGEAWADTGFVFTQPDVSRLHPQHVSDPFQWLAYLAAGVEMKVVQETLGHTSSAFTADTYTSVYPQAARAAAEKTAALLPSEEHQSTGRQTHLAARPTVGLRVRPRSRRLLAARRGHCSSRSSRRR
ncbi:hypothetical protein [Nonomuraea sp. B1E8]|uniref:hypothetical protein n=1 Tax=unclassified Nonomuraea TaxID=2593643 RepID=UPI00325E3182